VEYIKKSPIGDFLYSLAFGLNFVYYSNNVLNSSQKTKDKGREMIKNICYGVVLVVVVAGFFTNVATHIIWLFEWLGF